MSLRAEYKHAAVFNKDARQWEVTVFHHQFGKAKVVGRESVAFEWMIEPTANRLISAHMEKVTQILERDPRSLVTLTPKEGELS